MTNDRVASSKERYQAMLSVNTEAEPKNYHLRDVMGLRAGPMVLPFFLEKSATFLPRANR